MDNNQLLAEILKLSCLAGEIKSILISNDLVTAEEFDASVDSRIELMKLNISTLSNSLEDPEEVLKHLWSLACSIISDQVIHLSVYIKNKIFINETT